ncbi:MAG: ATP-binding cassette domain-containing protein, partial [Microthrixaceae bacterium]|nr:ATP-binding cassette domain-containing protein [Microthrixaceae bacterium]
FNLLPGRTALEQVVMPLMYSHGATFWRRRELAAEMLERVGLAGRLDSKPEKLSGGEQQRVAIARALVRKPRLILADEPTGALDIDTGATVMALLDEVATESGAALITITHDLHVAARARRHYRLDGGILRPADLELAFAASTLAVDASAEAALGLSVADASPTPDGER